MGSLGFFGGRFGASSQALAIRIGYCIGFTISMDIVLPNVVRPHCRNYNTIQYTTIQLLFVSYFFCFSPFIFASFLITYSLFLFLIFLPFPSSLPDLAPTISHSHSLSTGSFIVLFVVHPISGDPDSLFLISCWTPEILLKYGEYV